MLLAEEALTTMPEYGCYSLHLYCDTVGCKNQNAQVIGTGSMEPRPPGEFTGQTHAECVRTARLVRWALNNAGEVFCPLCTRKGPIKR